MACLPSAICKYFSFNYNKPSTITAIAYSSRKTLNNNFSECEERTDALTADIVTTASFEIVSREESPIVE